MLYTGFDVLRRARVLLTGDGVKSGHGAFCPWCAIADAQGQLADEHGISPVAQISGMNDFPLWEAKALLGGEHQPDALTQEQALALLDAAAAKEATEG